MRKATAMAGAVSLAAASAACGRIHDDAHDGGPTVSRSFAVGNFTSVEAAGPFDVKIHTGASPGVQVRGSEELIDKLEVEVHGDKLVVRPERKGWFGGWHSTNGKAEVAITVPALNSATLAGSGGLAIDRVQGDSFDGKIAGSGKFQLDSVTVGRLRLVIAGSGDAVTRSGQAKTASYDIAGSGAIDAAGVQSQDVDISIAGAGGIKVNATGTAKVKIVGSGDVDVTGGAKCEVSKAGSGNVHCS